MKEERIMQILQIIAAIVVMGLALLWASIAIQLSDADNCQRKIDVQWMCKPHNLLTVWSFN
jgi:hypothetical protein